MYFKNSIGKVYLINLREIVLEIGNSKFTFVGYDSDIIKETFIDAIRLMVQLEKEMRYIERLILLLNDDHF